MAHISLKRAGTGEYTTADGNYCIQNPHIMDTNDPDRKWYMFKTFYQDIYGPFDSLNQVRSFLREEGLV